MAQVKAQPSYSYSYSYTRMLVDVPDNDPELEALCGQILALFELRIEDDRETYEGKSIAELRELVLQREPPDDEFLREVWDSDSDIPKRGLRLAGKGGVFLLVDVLFDGQYRNVV